MAPSLASEAPALFEGFPTDAPWSTFRVVSGGSFMMVSVGLVVLCVGVLRAGLAPRWATVVVALAALLAAGLAPVGPQAVAPLVTAALGVGLIGWAAWLWTNAVEHHSTGDLTA